MSVHSDSRAVIFLADHAEDGGNGKVYALGAGIRLVGIAPNGQTPPMSVVVMIDVPSKYVGDDFPISIDLRRDDTNELVRVQMPPTGQLEPLRIQQMVRPDPPIVPGLSIPREVGARIQMVLNFANGLVLQPNSLYRWSLEIDGQSNKAWHATFYVIGPPPPPVFGGPANPASADMPPLREYRVPRTEETPAEGGDDSAE
jgi:hypothetical protein